MDESDSEGGDPEESESDSSGDEESEEEDEQRGGEKQKGQEATKKVFAGCFAHHYPPLVSWQHRLIYGTTQAATPGSLSEACTSGNLFRKFKAGVYVSSSCSP